MATLRRPSRVPPRLCIKRMGAILAIDHLESLNRTAAGWRARLRRPPHVRVREPLSHYKSFYLWQVSREERVPKRREQLGEQFVRWVNATPNLQASTFRHPGAVQQAVKAPEKRGKEDPSEAFISASDSREWRPRLGAALAHFDLVSPTEEFDAAFLLAAETLGLQHVSFHRVEPTCQKGYLERYDLEDPSQCAQLEQNVAHCEWWRRPACAPEWQAECDAAVRRVAPLDAWLHRTATRRFRATMEAVDGGFAARLAAFQAKRFGVWKGGPPTRPKCKFVRLTSEQWSSYRPLDFERHLCTPGPQAAVKAVWRNSQMLGRAAIVPNNATCRADPTSPECSVPPSTAGATRHRLDIYVLRTRLEDHLLRLGRGQRRRRRGGGRRRRQHLQRLAIELLQLGGEPRAAAGAKSRRARELRHAPQHAAVPVALRLQLLHQRIFLVVVLVRHLDEPPAQRDQRGEEEELRHAVARGRLHHLP